MNPCSKCKDSVQLMYKGILDWYPRNESGEKLVALVVCASCGHTGDLAPNDEEAERVWDEDNPRSETTVNVDELKEELLAEVKEWLKSGERRCSTCAHSREPLNKHPCSECHGDTFPMWKPKGE